MAEMLVLSALTEAVIAQTIERISDLLIHEEASLASVKEEVESLRSELRRMHSFLRSADNRQAESADERVRNWVSEIRNIACEIEDVIEIYIVKAEDSFVNTFHLRSLRKQIESIKTRMKSIFESRTNYDIRFDSRDVAGVGAGPSAVALRRSYPDDEEEDEKDDVTGLDTTALKIRLLEESDQLDAIPIVGMGGLGKTTLAKKAYNDCDVKQHFDCCAWVLISQQCIARDVFSEILIQIGDSQSQYTNVLEEIDLEERKKESRKLLKTMEEGELIGLIKNKLRGKRYLVVLDDIWRVDDWDSIRRIFPRGKKGSKVVFTTRMKELASYADPRGSPIEPPLLTLEESWELLHRKAFPSDVFGERGCPPEFERMGKEMVKKCEGLPLAIVVLGGLLRTKNSEDEWKKVEKDVNAHLNRYRYGNQYGVEEMLALSYYDLPYYLKPCFLYLGSFPEDMEIPRRKLIQLWVAEGLVIEPITTRGQTMEEIAEQYLRELIDRCMVQVGNRDHTGVGVKTCRVHHLMRDFCVSKAREDEFSEVIRQQEIKHETARSSSFSTQQMTLTTRTRRIAIHPGCNLDPTRVHPHLRSLLCFDAISSSSLVQYIRSKNLRLLRVLEFGFNRSTMIHKCKVPTEIGELIHLRYLGLRDAGKVKLPRSIGNLRNLSTINLRENTEVVLPVEILRLKRLKHLLLPFGTYFPQGFSWPTYVLSDPREIQTLKYIRFGQFLLRNKMIRPEFANLRNLGVQFKSNEEVRLFLLSPNFELGMLQSLHMSMLSSAGFSGLQPLRQCVILSKLILEGKISKSQNLEFLPMSLTKLILRDSGLREDPMPVLEKLRNLRFLGLHNAYVGSEMVCGVEGFPRLETLQLFSLEEVTRWEIMEYAMPNLKRLHIKHMLELTMIPEGLKNITSLRELKISDMRRSFEDRLRVKDGIEGADFYKVRHVSSISFSWTLQSRYQYF